MNKLSLKLSITIILFAVTKLQAQYYTFNQSSQTYQSIANPQFSITDSATIDTNAAMITVNYNSLQPMAFGEHLSGLMQAGPDGSLVAIGINSDFIFDPFFTGLRALGTSEFRATELIQGNDTIFEMEWFEFGIQGAPNTHFITMKARFYLTKELIEFYFGSSHLGFSTNFSFGPYSGLFHATKGFGSYKEVMILTGNPVNPIINTTSTGVLSTFPPSGTVYRFTGPQVTSLSERKIKGLALNLFPNPTNGTINIDSKKKIAKVMVYNNLGQEVYSLEDINSNQVVINLNLAEGYYSVLTTFTNGTLPSSKQLIIK